MAHIQKVPSRAPAGDLLNMLAMRGLEQGDGTAAPGQTVQWTVCQPAGESPCPLTQQSVFKGRTPAGDLLNMLAMRGLEQGDGGYRCHFVGADACIGPRANNVRPYTSLHGIL